MISFLIFLGAEVDLRTEFPSTEDSPVGATALHLAILKDQSLAVQQLINAGCDVNKSFVTSDHGILMHTPHVIEDLGAVSATPLHLALIKNNAEVFDMLLRVGSKLNSKLGLFRKNDEDGGMVGVDEVNMLQVAVSMKHYHMIGKLLNACKENFNKLDINFKTIDGITAFHLAIHVGMRSIVQALIDLKCDLKSKAKCDLIGYCLCPFHMAVKAKNVRICEILVTARIDMNMTCTLSGQTALWEALHSESYEVGMALIANGADYTIQDKDGKSVLKFIKDTGHKDLMEKVTHLIMAKHNRDMMFKPRLIPCNLLLTASSLNDLGHLQCIKGLCIIILNTHKDKDIEGIDFMHKYM